MLPMHPTAGEGPGRISSSNVVTSLQARIDAMATELESANAKRAAAAQARMALFIQCDTNVC
jgi:hypothetical protein